MTDQELLNESRRMARERLETYFETLERSAGQSSYQAVNGRWKAKKDLDKAILNFMQVVDRISKEKQQ